MPPVGWIGLVERAQHLAVGVGRCDARRGSRPSVSPVTVRQSPCSRPASSSAFMTTGTPPIWSTSFITCRPNGLTSARCGTFGADPGEVVERQLDVGLVGDRQQVQHRVGGAAERHHHRDRVLERLLGQDVAGGDAAAQQLDDGLPAARANPSRRRSVAGGDALPGSDMPSASAALAMVLAVYMPPQAPSPGQMARSIASTSSRTSARARRRRPPRTRR